MPEKVEKLTIALDGKTVRSTNKMRRSNSALHIISAQISELGITFAQKGVDAKTNEIPTVQKLLEEVNIKGTVIVADALNCQKETAEIVIKQKADYLLSVKDNHKNLKKDIEEYINDETCQKRMKIKEQTEKGHGRIEKRTGYVSSDIDWMEQKEEWNGLKSIGAIHTEFTDKNGKTTSEWHYYISSREMTPEELLHYARMEWSVETMHWMLDVHFEEDWCRVEDRTVQQNLNIARKFALNIIKLFKERTETKRAVSNIMLDCLIDINSIVRVIGKDYGNL